jgi:hypothetical protein
MGDPLGPSGLLKASLNEPNRQQLQHSIDCYIVHWNVHIKGVSKPSTLSPYSPYSPYSTQSPLAAGGRMAKILAGAPVPFSISIGIG